jgi:hypothetical protein
MFYLDDQEPEEPQDEDTGDEQNTSNEENESSGSLAEQNNSSSIKKATNNRISNAKKSGRVLDKMKKTKSMSFIKVIAPILPYVVGFVLAFIVVVGLIMFLIIMPGTLMGKLNELFDSVVGFLISIWQDDAEIAVTDQAVIDVADYLESMGYDLREYGFVTSAVTDPVSSQISSSLTEDEINNALIDSNGIGRNSDGITNINSEVIRTYLLSDNYVYCCRNFNKSLKTAFESFGTFIDGLFGNSIAWGKGLITIYREDTTLLEKESIGEESENYIDDESEGNVGIAGKSYNNHWWNKENISIDKDTKTLNVKTKTGILGLGKTKILSYKLEGWTARYGMPLEFLLAVHITSMSPDLAVDLATSFDTQVVILLHPATATVEAAFYNDDGTMITMEDINNVSTNLNTDSNGTARMKAWYIMKSLNLKNPDCQEEPKCYDRVVEQGEANAQNTSACASCFAYVSSLRNCLSAINDNSFSTYIPYISKVTDHWFRDVYFVAPSETEVITNDEDYEAETGERWTKYETTTDADGNVSYVLYRLNDDGTIGEKYDGTSDDAEREGVKVTKKAITTTISDIAEEGTIQYYSWFGEGYWSAYKIEDTESTNGWTLYSPTDDTDDESTSDAISSSDAVEVPEALQNKIYYRLTMSNNIVQIQDGQRGLTNEKIKKIFSTNKYYMYDGTLERAKAIEKDKEKTDRSKDNTPEDERDPDLISSFSVTRDSLTAFNILENMNTFDADSIYRDFKELIVELNYFDKEDLTQTASVVWEWPLAETGSGGWPLRRYEKIEDEYGTLINSAVDLENLKAVDKASQDLTGSGEADIEDEEEEETTAVSVTENTTNLSEVTDSMGSNSLITNKNTTNISDMLGSSSSDLKGSTFLQTAQNCWEYIVNSGNYTYGGASVPVSNGTTVDCSSFVSWVLYEYRYEDFGGGQHSASQFYNTDWETAYGWQEIDVEEGEDCSSLLQAGDILVRYGEVNGKTVHHVQIIKEVEPNGNIVTYDCGASSHWASDNIDGYNSSNYAKAKNNKGAPGKIIRIENQTEYTDEFKGYGAYEDVVSPITGEIIEAGTTTITNIETNVEEEVGYIKIKALDESDYQTYFNSTDEGLEGYKYFYEDYEKAKVAGDILYIEGFDLRIVDDKLNLIQDDAIIDETDEFTNLYTKDTYEDVYSDDARETLEKKEEKRDKADAVVQTSDGKIFVKEGTVLGKTYTDGTESGEVSSDAKERPGIANMTDEQKTMTDSNGNVINKANGNYIRLILRTADDGSDATSNKDSIIENIEDYLETDNSEREETDWEFYYWLPYESAGLDSENGGPADCETVSGDNEIAVGIVQWTSLYVEDDESRSFNNIAPLCKWLYEQNPSLCSPLSVFSSYSEQQMTESFDDLKSAWATVVSQDRDAFLQLQFEYFYENDFKSFIKDDGIDWILDKSLVVQGTYASLKNWTPNAGWKDVIDSSMSDEEICKVLLTKACGINSTVGTLETRWESQYALARDILNGSFTDVENWVRTKQPSDTYGEGNNSGLLAMYVFDEINCVEPKFIAMIMKMRG